MFRPQRPIQYSEAISQKREEIVNQRYSDRFRFDGSPRQLLIRNGNCRLNEHFEYKGQDSPSSDADLLVGDTEGVAPDLITGIRRWISLQTLIKDMMTDGRAYSKD